MHTYSTSTASCQVITSVKFGYGLTMISSTELILCGILATYQNYIYKVSFGNTALSWADKITCSTATCAMNSAEFILSSDGLTLYSFFMYHDGKFFYTLLLYLLLQVLQL